MHKNIVIPALILICLFFASCRDNSSNPSNNNNKPAIDTVKFVYYTKVFDDHGYVQIIKLDMATGIEEVFRDSAFVLGIANGFIYFFTADTSYKSDLWKCKPDGSEKVKLGSWATNYLVYGQLSSDGSKLIYYAYNKPDLKIHCTNPDGTNDIIVHEYSNYNSDDPYPFAGFSPDMKTIGLLNYNKDVDYTWIFSQCNIDGTNKHEVMSLLGWIHMRGCWSPDGKKLAYLNYIPATQKFKLALVYIDTKISQTLVNDNNTCFNITWSPDGNKIAYYSDPGKLNIINSDGTNLVEVTNIPSKQNDMKGLYPVWSPGSTQILFQTSINEKGGDVYFGDLKLYNTQTKELRTLVAKENVWNAFFL